MVIANKDNKNEQNEYLTKWAQATHFMHSKRPTNKKAKTFLWKTKKHFSDWLSCSSLKKSEETRGNATAHLQSHPIPKLYILWQRMGDGIPLCFFVSLRGGIWQAITKSFSSFVFCFLFHWEIQLPPSGNNNNSEKLTVFVEAHHLTTFTWIICTQWKLHVLCANLILKQNVNLTV